MLLAPFSRTHKSYQASLYDTFHRRANTLPLSSPRSVKRRHLLVDISQDWSTVKEGSVSDLLLQMSVARATSFQQFLLIPPDVERLLQWSMVVLLMLHAE